jgi:hypothetical protein
MKTIKYLLFALLLFAGCEKQSCVTCTLHTYAIPAIPEYDHTTTFIECGHVPFKNDTVYVGDYMYISKISCLNYKIIK